MSASTSVERPGLIEARPVRHPWRWVALALIAIVVAMMLSSFITNKRWDWGFALQVMNQTPVLEGLWKGTIIGTVGAMIIGVSLGIVIAIMRLSENPVLKWVAFAYTWFFRAIPRYVLLAILGSGVGYLYSTLDVGVPFGQQLASALGLSSNLTFLTLNVNALSNSIIAGIVGLGLSEAAQALGMSSGKTMRRIVLPQAMRVIVPPTGNEAIAMVKDTSLLIAIPIIAELFYQTSAIGVRTLKIMPGFVAATLWYLIICSILMVGQYYLERHFGRGFGQKKPKDRRFARGAGMGGA